VLFLFSLFLWAVSNIKSTNDVSAGQLVNVAGTYDCKTLKFFVNGQLVNSSASSGVFEFADLFVAGTLKEHEIEPSNPRHEDQANASVESW